MHLVPLNSYQAFEEAVADLRGFLGQKQAARKIGGISDPLFRGHAKAGWFLHTSLDRYLDRHLEGERVSVEDYHSFLWRIKPAVETHTGRTWPLEKTLDLGDDFFSRPPGYNFMVYTRHHGFPSPLLDWTRSPYIALYFAFEEARDDTDVAVFAFVERPEGIKSGWVGAPHVTEQGPYATTHQRHFVQQAMYTTCVHRREGRWEYYPHEDYFGRADDRQDYLRKFVLPGSLRFEILSRLAEMNINAHTLFSSEESLMKALAFKEILATTHNRRRQRQMLRGLEPQDGAGEE